MHNQFRERPDRLDERDDPQRIRRRPIVSDIRYDRQQSPGEPNPSVIDVPTSSTAPPASLDPVAQEAADRAAIEAQWIKFWNVYETIARLPEDQRTTQLDTVAVPPITNDLLKVAEEANRDGLDNYGSVVHRLSWQFPVDGKSDAVIADCQDQSQSGIVKIASGEIQTVGEARSNMRGQFVKGPDGIWRLSSIFALEQEC